MTDPTIETVETTALAPVALLIDSDPEARARLAAILKTRHAVSVAETGAAGLAYLRRGETPCLIVYMLRADDDGNDFRTVQQAEPSWADIPTVLFSVQSEVLSAAFVEALFTLLDRNCHTD